MAGKSNTAISVKGISKSFKIPLDKGQSVKRKILGRAGKGYREFTPLNDVSFTVEKGDFFGIVGRNGSGKSTLLKTIAGIYEPTKGKIAVNGRLVPFIELGVGFNPQLTGSENVYLNGALLGFSRSEIDEMYDDIVDFAELHDFMEERLQNYSSGMQVRLAFSIAIRAKGDILLLDEVLAVGDTAFQQKCYDYFEQLKQEGKTVILVTHSMANVERFCNRALLLDSGEVKAIGTGDSIANEYNKLFNRSNSSIPKEDGVSGGEDAYIKAGVVQSGVDTSIVETDDSFSVKIEYGADIKVSDPDIIIVLRNDKGVQLMSTNVNKLLGKRPPIVAGKRYECNITVDNVFTNGNYTLVAKLNGNNDKGARTTYAFSEKHMRIEGRDSHAYSLVHPTMEVSIKEV